ncbi:MAG TPA: helix-turn-helix domain-containing protein, partial [Dehalococcoidia bacterium]
MLRVTLAEDDQTALQQQRRDPTLTPLERDWVEIVLLAAAGWSAPRIAAHLGRCGPTVRTTLHRFAAGGAAGLRQQRTGPPPDTARREQVTAALDRLLGEDRTWTAAQLAAALGEEGIALSTRQTRKYLQAMGARWRRVVRTLHHKQDSARVARATAVLTALKK